MVLPSGEKAGEDGGGLAPVTGFFFELRAAGASEFVEFCFAVVVRDAPFGGDKALLLEFHERGIKRAVIHGKEIAAGLLDATSDSVAVKRAEGLKGLEDHEGESAAPDVLLFRQSALLWESNRLALDVLESNRKFEASRSQRSALTKGTWSYVEAELQRLTPLVGRKAHVAVEAATRKAYKPIEARMKRGFGRWLGETSKGDWLKLRRPQTVPSMLRKCDLRRAGTVDRYG